MTPPAPTFDEFFAAAFDQPMLPYRWQNKVANEGFPEILPIPTGLGKTEGTVLPWAWRRRSGAPWPNEPQHLIYCLPMRVLVRQTVQRLKACFARLEAAYGPQPTVYTLMGGTIDDAWLAEPDRPWVLVGTQDQLLSRALNRGYAMSRFEWPIAFGLLNQDCRWIVDETQLMGPGLWTTSQLDWMRRKRFAGPRPLTCPTTWMSATIGTGFLATTDRRVDGIDKPALSFDPELQADSNDELRIRCAALRKPRWFAKNAGRHAPPLYTQLAKAAADAHTPGTLSLVVCNTVEHAFQIYRDPELSKSPAEKVLLTSRFRATDRAEHESRLLEFDARRSRQGGGPLTDHPGLICVSTQVVEAGIDISAHQLWTELAPWPSLIQRLGRLNRDGRANQEAHAIIWRDAEETGPYRAIELKQAKELIDALIPLTTKSPFAAACNGLALTMPQELTHALEPQPAAMPRACDVHGLFSTEPDLHGGFTDVSAFVRGADPDPDILVFWRSWKPNAAPRGSLLTGPEPSSEEMCPVACKRLRQTLETGHAQAWAWDDDRQEWARCPHDQLRPGMVVMLRRSSGCYSPALGWTGAATDDPGEAQAPGPGRGAGDEPLAERKSFVELRVHLDDTTNHIGEICDSVGLSPNSLLRAAVVAAAEFHDIGKALPTWQEKIPSLPAAPGSGPWAKFVPVLALEVRGPVNDFDRQVRLLRREATPLPPAQGRRPHLRRLRWAIATKLSAAELARLRSLHGVAWAGHLAFRPGFRHEAASASAMWARRTQVQLPALAVYLAAAHHGKVRTVMRAPTGSGEVFGARQGASQIRFMGQEFPLDFAVAQTGTTGEWLDGGFVPEGPGWTGIVADLLGPWEPSCPISAGAVPKDEPRCLGPFALAWLEALVRAADWRASNRPSLEGAPEARSAR